jgi:putative transposase
VSAVPDPIRFAIDFLPEVRRQVWGRGVDFHGVRYWSSKLVEFFGSARGSARHAMVKYDPRDLSRLYVPISDEPGGYLEFPYGNSSRPRVSLVEIYRARAALGTSRSWAPSEDQLFAKIEEQRSDKCGPSLRSRTRRAAQPR